jgi:hypothetical protein
MAGQLSFADLADESWEAAHSTFLAEDDRRREAA